MRFPAIGASKRRLRCTTRLPRSLESNSSQHDTVVDSFRLRGLLAVPVSTILLIVRPLRGQLPPAAQNASTQDRQQTEIAQQPFGPVSGVRDFHVLPCGGRRSARWSVLVVGPSCRQHLGSACRSARSCSCRILSMRAARPLLLLLVGSSRAASRRATMRRRADWKSCRLGRGSGPGRYLLLDPLPSFFQKCVLSILGFWLSITQVDHF